MARLYSYQERNSIEDYRRQHPGQSQRGLADMIFTYSKTRGHALSGRSKASIYAAVRAFDERMKFAASI